MSIAAGSQSSVRHDIHYSNGGTGVGSPLNANHHQPNNNDLNFFTEFVDGNHNDY